MTKNNPDQKSEILEQLTKLSEVIDFFAEKSNTDVMRMTYEIAVALNLPGLQLKVCYKIQNDGILGHFFGHIVLSKIHNVG